MHLQFRTWRAHQHLQEIDKGTTDAIERTDGTLEKSQTVTPSRHQHRKITTVITDYRPSQDSLHVTHKA